MSEQALKDFISEANGNPELATGFVAALDGKTGADAYHAVSDFASSRGYDVTYDDAKAVHAAILSANDNDSELTDESLDDVSGGEVVLAIGLTVAAIAGGALATVIGAKLIGNHLPGEVGDFFRSW